jgi:hypothetical protein
VVLAVVVVQLTGGRSDRVSDTWIEQMREWPADGAPISENVHLLDCDQVADASDSMAPDEYLKAYYHDTVLGQGDGDALFVEVVRSDYSIPDSVTDDEIARVAADEVAEVCGF